ncbi:MULTISPECIES: hypothetical protein [Bacillus]|jgi:hypothetical protein|uniref:Uncharacterized protein n=1 Tax=Bacillus subtilis TaxID=1423 RepID=A0AAP1E6K2_BACIU|nr:MULTISPECIES: hypothetical protein [Bacillus]KIN53104.1 hypothetical protein B4146_2025 [Bacillus subtilis]KZD95219.1 hypothetical protein B4122_0191 [Bacillus subtilis]
MNMVKNGDSIKVVFVFQKSEQIKEVELNSAQLSAFIKLKTGMDRNIQPESQN